MYVDEVKLRQIYINLIGNAIKFSEKGTIWVVSKIINALNNTFTLQVEVHDEGSGIPADEMDRLFKHFEQTSSGRNKGSGTGLGLALSKELAMLMGGNITATSHEGVGSVFTFYVQIQLGIKENVEIINTNRVLGISSHHEPIRILIVDDKEENLIVAENLLKQVGFETNTAINGQDGVEKFQSWQPHLILMDLRMPVMDGYEATRIIKSTPKGEKIFIVALTARAIEEQKKKLNGISIDGYIHKPFRENELFNTIGNLLNIQYVYDNSNELKQSNNQVRNKENVAKAILQLPTELIEKMYHAVSTADLDLLLELIKTIDPNLSQLAEDLTTLANDYDYDFLQKIFK